MAVNVMNFTLPPLPYAYNALEPAISAQIMQLHHDKHHQAYVNNLNAALVKYSTASVPDQIALQQAIKFNGGGHINHSLFWQNLAPANSTETAMETAAPTLSAALSAAWGSPETFKASFNAALMGIQGSGWGWLVKDGSVLRIITTKDQDPVVGGEIPIFGVDMWEHAYYLQYQNGKASYVDNIWSVINWATAEERFKGTREDAFTVLKVTMS